MEELEPCSKRPRVSISGRYSKQIWKLQDYEQPEESSSELTVADIRKETFLDIQDRMAYDCYTLHNTLRWYKHQVPYNKDFEDFQTLDESVKNLLVQVSAFFAIADAVVGSTIQDISPLLDLREHIAYYGVQFDVENVHAEVYGDILKILIGKDVNTVIDNINSMPTMIAKRNFVKRYSSGPLAEKIAANIFVEGIFFQGSFPCILWLKTRGLCPGITTANQWIARDESLHWQFGCHMAKRLNVDADFLLNLAEEAVDIERRFLFEVFRGRDESLYNSLNPLRLLQHVKACCNEILETLDLDPLYPNCDKIEYMKMLNYHPRTNVFETSVTTYSIGPSCFDRAVPIEEDEHYTYVPL